MGPKLFDGSQNVDERGQLSFVHVNLDGIKRIYTVENHDVGRIRAWHGHKEEAKYVHVVQGTALITTMEIDDWDLPSNLKIYKHTLSHKVPKILYIPAGYVNGSMTLEANTKIMYFSTSTYAESILDDYRWPWDKWNTWTIPNY